MSSRLSHPALFRMFFLKRNSLTNLLFWVLAFSTMLYGRAGDVDPTFPATLGYVPGGRIVDFAIQADGKIVVANERGISRLLNSGALASFDFDGDGRADVSVFRPSTNRWYELLSSTSQVVETTFGAAGDIAVPADFDGDGKTDEAIFRPSTGIWYLLQSTAGFAGLQFGIATDVAIPNALVP
ncbi:MAG: FG-GAP repeat domain-containing protein [Blastocatellia bacterium]